MWLAHRQISHIYEGHARAHLRELGPEMISPEMTSGNLPQIEAKWTRQPVGAPAVSPLTGGEAALSLAGNTLFKLYCRGGLLGGSDITVRK